MLLLIANWILYFFLHSLLAADCVKHWFKTSFKLHGRYYRIFYNLFNLLTLPLLLVWHYQTPSVVLFEAKCFYVFTGSFVLLAGLVIMLKAGLSYNLPVFFGLRTETKMPLRLSGLHRYVRHPLYAGTLLFCAGLCIVFPILKNFFVLLLMFLYLLIGINLEERKLVATFGDAYRNYQKKVKRLIPGLL